jgi:16S rRNA (adenine1518-N6/adenine1519-N6)-dimethyltransferase
MARLLPRTLVLALLLVDAFEAEAFSLFTSSTRRPLPALAGWIQRSDGEWDWKEDDPDYVAPVNSVVTLAGASATPQLPSGSYKPKQSLGQNYLRDGNTVIKIIRAFHNDATRGDRPMEKIVELGPGAGALTDKLIETYGADALQCVEIDERSVGLLVDKHPGLRVRHADVLQVDYPTMAKEVGQPLVVIGNLPYYITSQILFALADASHFGAVHSATVTMQWEVGQRMVAPTRTKDYGILSVVFQLYAEVNCHFKIPPTVFYPKPKVDSALIGLHFVGPDRLRRRLGGVQPFHLRRLVTTAFQQRRKTLRNSLRKLAREVSGGDAEAAASLFQSIPREPPLVPEEDREDAFFATRTLLDNWASMRPEELTSGQFVEVTRIFFGPADGQINLAVPLETKVWRKLKHGSS